MYIFCESICYRFLQSENVRHQRVWFSSSAPAALLVEETRSPRRLPKLAGRPLAVVSYFAPSPSCASQDGFKGLIGNVVHLLLGHDHPRLLPVEGGQPLLEKAGQLVSNFACHHFD